MNDPFVARELECQAAEDAAAYNRLSRPKQRLASFFASIGFTGREGLVGASGMIVGVLEAVLHAIFIWPYIALSRVAVWCAESAVKVVIVALDAILCLAVALVTNVDSLLSMLIRHIDSRLAGASYARMVSALMRVLRVLRRASVLLRFRLQIWRPAAVRFIEGRWREAKLFMRDLFATCYRGLEYYGAIAVYRFVKWMLNPRRPSGLPLLGGEKFNMIFGISMAALGFVAFAALLLAIGVWAKLMHAELALAFATDAGPLGLRIAKQVVFQPLITIGLTAAKFVLLPIIAATRQALKSADFTRGIAFAYNRRLRLRKKRNGSRTSSQAAMKRTVLPVVSVFVAHLVEKSSPSFYEGRSRWYQSQRKGTRRFGGFGH